MCTYLTEHVGIDSSGKGATGWFDANRATVYVDRPVHAPYGHTVDVDVIDPQLGPSARVALELTEEERAGAGRRYPEGDRPRAGRTGLQGSSLSDDRRKRTIPPMAATRGRIEAAPRRVRGYLGEALVFDTTAARYVWEVPSYPQYYVPVVDVRSEFLHDENRSQKVQFGPSRLYSLVGAGRTHEAAARVLNSTATARWPVPCGSSGIHCAGSKKNKPIYGHPRDPYSRVDALRSHRHVRVELDGIVLADTKSPVLLSKPGLPTRYYIDPTDGDFEHLEPSATKTLCPYKGVTSGYWSVRAGRWVSKSCMRLCAWTYRYPLPAVGQIAGLIAFYNEKLDIAVDERGWRSRRRSSVSRRAQIRNKFLNRRFIQAKHCRFDASPVTASLRTAADSQRPVGPNWGVFEPCCLILIGSIPETTPGSWWRRPSSA